MYEEMEKENIERGRELQEREMEMEMKMKMENDKDFSDDKNGVEVINNVVGGGYYYNINKDRAPVDDVCPICFDRFNVPCRSNCGHWFCASCILQFWMYKSSIQPCKCPLCCCLILNLNPETSQLIQPTNNTVKVLKKVQQYNDLYVNGARGIFLKFQVLPLLLRRILRLMINPDGLRCIYYVMRLLGLLLALLYEKAEFEFIPTGGLGIQRSFDMGASVLVLTLCLVGVGHRWRERRMVAGLDAPEDTS